jgi:hypothetical protein
MTRVTGAVVAHPNRTGRARALAGGVLDVVTGSGPAAWLSIPDRSTHHFLVHDTMILSATFFERVQNAAKTTPDAALVLFTAADSRNGAAVRQGALAGARWVPVANEYLPTAGIVLPQKVVRGYVEYAREHAGTWPENVLLYRFLKQEGVQVVAAVPNLVDYSLGDKDSRSACFFANDPDEGDEPGLAELSVIPFFAHGIAQCAVRMADGWRTILCEEYLRRFDIGDLPRRSEFGSDTEQGAWLTGFAMGVINRFEGHGVSQSGLVLDRALATIGHTTRLHAFAWDGLRSGMSVAPKSRDLVSPTVRVSCDGSFLGDYLLYTLAGRGYHVTRDSPADVVVYLAGEPVAADGAKLAVCLTGLTGSDLPLPGTKTCVLRLGVPYGPGMPAEEPVARFVRTHEEIEPQQLVHVNDITDAVEAVMLRDPPSDVYAIANPGLTGSEELRRALDLPGRRRTKPANGPAVPVDKAERELGWRQRITLAYGLRMYSEWLAYETDD